jgi:hypothetical protein
VLYAATARFCISDRPECVGHEYMEDGTEYCEVTVHIDASGRFPEMGPWCVTATGTRLSDTFQLVAHKALKCLYQMCESHLGPMLMKYFSPLDYTVLPGMSEFTLWKDWDLKKKTPPSWPWQATCLP